MFAGGHVAKYKFERQGAVCESRRQRGELPESLAD